MTLGLVIQELNDINKKPVVFLLSVLGVSGKLPLWLLNHFCNCRHDMRNDNSPKKGSGQLILDFFFKRLKKNIFQKPLKVLPLTSH